MPYRLSLCAALALTGCAGTPELAAPVAVSPAVVVEVPAAVDTPAVAPGASAPRDCPPLKPAIMVEAGRLTPVTPEMHRALILAEIEKNRALVDAVAAYERCRKS